MIGAAIGGSLINAGASNKAAKAQQAAAQADLALKERIYGETTDRFEPFLEAGTDYQNALRFELLGGDRPSFGGDPLDVSEFTETTTQPNGSYNALNPYWGSRSGDAQPQNTTTSNTRFRVGEQIFDTRDAADAYAQANPTGAQEYQGFQATPGYQFQLDQGRQAIDASAASRGGLFSGATLKSQQSYGQGVANQEYGNYLNRLSSGAASGQAAAGNMANAGANYSAGAGQAYANMGNAQSAGAIGVGNALSGGLNNIVGIMNYQNSLAGGGGGGGLTSSLFPQARPF